MKKILVTGGAGYIGAHTVNELKKAKYKVVIFDKASDKKQNLLDKKAIDNFLAKEKVDGVIHFAAYALAGESMNFPQKYFENNLQGGLNLLEAMVKHKVKNIVFSSSCAIYGFPDKLPVTENETKKPVSVYGESKLMFEKILDWYDQIYGIKNIKLRYFNAAGAALDGSIGENHQPETHIIPLVIEAILKNKTFKLYGNDYHTKDGSCVRDYIHVLDLASAHIKALEYLFSQNKSNFFNVGAGKGYSNKEIIKMVEKVSGKKVNVKIIARRAGDPDAIYADNTKIKRTLHWKPKYSDLDTIIESAWIWHHKK